ncbi:MULTISPECIES: multifunctional oxoglutarate decarboxylase/oxoglutarate dehydrogenase thiamine pyrophosphate-binding subunit/dihydrolipoyllysine-residue succinyltransferase subunit [unclassified Dietzia]|uniref:multifunctional oxoglutarate decarboxylase/oxoglutarate dehydrogenase thiamine pyrophosphate-binding subunit/dihydrolipoyllysine-residue succinyltransferase subunit n=1 Tax=unclassified Dietzia TaxID=2617939 RepID=UPI0013162974|nr:MULTISPECIES: multifunctional oxoglutarate decarboxylase/oxoglutarate dehydrogenase thiamine pyrophosphate-binding subunit/dihydrolipoyllysine-residue succinyltransferase subunit [unclassified Dietzia]QGW25046.1 alpha-ketoglutarate decarboxylase [Dietzia sp. DQ12-45-1b]
MSKTVSQFGQNQWLVDEMYERFSKDPSSVDESWHEFFDANPGAATGRDASKGSSGAGPASDGGDTRTGGKNNGDGSGGGKKGKKVSADASGGDNATPDANTQKTSELTVADVSPESSAKDVAAKPADDSTPARKARGQGVPAPVRSTEKRKKDDAPAAKRTTRPEYAPPEEPENKVLRGPANAIVKNMNASLSLPTATSVRAVPAKLMIDNRIVINNHLKRTHGGKISFTHLIGYAMVQAVKAYPNMNNYFEEIDGKPNVVTPNGINLGLAIDMKTKAGRTLVVAAIRNCERLDFRGFLDAYEDIVSRARVGKLTMEDFSGVSISLTNPGGIGTVHSVPRLTPGQGAILGVGAMEYPAEFQGASDEQLANNAIGKITTLTSTYDHRIIQGAESGEFLREIHRLLLADEFYDEIFDVLGIPYEPVRWRQDITDPRVDKDARVLELIAAYRDRGHLMADIDPLDGRHAQRRRTFHPDLDVNSHELTLWDLDRKFSVGGFVGKDKMRLRDVLSALRAAYCRKIGIEYTHILENDQRQWIQDRLEGVDDKPTVAEQKYILSKVNAAEAFETFLQTKYVGQKRFSLEGAESVIPMMDAVIDEAAEFALDEVVIGMPHRGRLNVLANIVGKPYRQIFTEFEGNMDPSAAHGSGDVKYHLGAEGIQYQMFGENEIKVSLTANPSHLEAVDPVLEGIVRAKQDLIEDPERRAEYPVVPLMLHGDAAFAGQGVVAETLNLSQIDGYRTGGTIHIVVNNQIGFTTAPEAGRSSQYATDVAKMIGSPIFHVNGDDPEACVRVARLAMDFRQQFKKDVVIDLVCYRRRGHNEADDPSMTQPRMYEVIDAKKSVRQSYTDDLVGRGDITEKEAENALRDFQGQLERVFNEVRELEKHPVKASESILPNQPLPKRLVTAVDESVIHAIGDAFGNLPEDFHIHSRVKPVYEARQKMAYNGNIDWAFAELLAIGSLVQEGRTVRLAGQDSQRGTFTQRHAVVVDKTTSEPYSPLQNLEDAEGRFEVWNSALTEFAGVGFEYGYSVGDPEALVLWEAQFGDFVNGAQTIIDEYISSGEAKWGQKSSVTLLLPHGHEGMGPDHTSGRMERFLQLCAEGSMTVAQPSTPANYFHLMRRHATDGIKRPQIVFTPKSMLRNKKAVSALEDFTTGKFRSVLDDPTFVDGGKDPEKVTTMLLVSGKLYYELAARQEKEGHEHIAIVRLEQIHPIPFRRLREALGHYPNLSEVRWVQEEPANQGAWSFLALNLPEVIPEFPAIKRVSRRAMAATSTGLSKVHAVEQKALVDEAFA